MTVATLGAPRPRRNPKPVILKMDWKNPDYSAIFDYRMRTLDQLREGTPDAFLELKAWYRENPADFINDWGVTFDPRNAERRLPTIIPFVLFKRQREWIDFVLRKWRAQEPGLCEKSRDMGVYMAGDVAGLHAVPVPRGPGDRRRLAQDDLRRQDRELKPLLPKGRMFMEHLPVEFRGDWQAWRDAPSMRITFPETGSMISGEAGDDIGRGDRASIFWSTRPRIWSGPS
jgi:phage terminase large subunit